MSTVLEAIYEHGMLRPIAAHSLKEQQRYRIVLEEIEAPDSLSDPALAPELEQRLTILPDGRRIIDLSGILANPTLNMPDDKNPIADALDELRQERAHHFQVELDGFFPMDTNS